MNLHLYYIYISKFCTTMNSFFRIIAGVFFFQTVAFAQADSLVQLLHKKAKAFLLKDTSLAAYYTIDTAGIKMYSSPVHSKDSTPEFFVLLNDLPRLQRVLKNMPADTLIHYYKKGILSSAVIPQSKVNASLLTDTLQKLKGLRIAIDPGHIAGDMEMGEIEKKSLHFSYTTPHGTIDSINIAEGMLTFATAQLLKNKLEAQGAEVLLTRPANNVSAYGITFDEWLKKDYVKAVDSLYKLGRISAYQKQFFMSSKPSKRDKFRVIFKDIELSKRAEIINTYHPDITVIIHYNVDENNTDWKKPTEKNFNMAFVGGAFMHNDLSSPEKRFAFLRLLLTSDLEQSIALSGAVIKSFERNLGVKTATENDATYLKDGCLITADTGVYCRNLQLTRYIHGVLVYGETLYQDNVKESVLLNKETDKTKNQRIQQVAEAYFQGIVSFVYSTFDKGFARPE